MAKGIWIAFEGNDGSGKSTQIEKTAIFLIGQGLTVVTTREPGGNAYSEELRRLIFNPEVAHDPHTQLLLFVAARKRNILTTVLPALEKGIIVLSDRSEGSSFAYQHFQFGIPLEQMLAVNNFGTGGIKPDLTILLDVDEDIGLVRMNQAKGGEANHFDQSALEDWRKRREGYLVEAKEYQKFEMNPWEVVDANQEMEAVQEQIIKVLQNYQIVGQEDLTFRRLTI